MSEKRRYYIIKSEKVRYYIKAVKEKYCIKSEKMRYCIKQGRSKQKEIIQSYFVFQACRIQ